MNGSGSASKAAFRRSYSAWCWPVCFGVPAKSIPNAPSLSGCPCCHCSPCRSTIRQPSCLQVCARGILLVVLLLFAVRLSIGEVQYARGWSIPNAQDALSTLDDARNTYPFLARIREGFVLRIRIYAQKGT